jgi:hypothetical protein
MRHQAYAPRGRLSVADGGTQVTGCNKTANGETREVADNALNLHVVIIADRL